MLRVEFSKNNLTPFQSDLARILNLMKPVSVKIGTHLDTYAAKVTLEHEGRYNETSMEILSKGARLREAFCGTCEVYAYDLDEDGNPDNCYMFKKPTSYECRAYPDRITVEIEFGELHHGPNIDKKCKEIEVLNDFMGMMRKLMNEGDDNMKHFSECIGECITCATHGHCLAGIGDDDYVMADKAELVRRIKNDNLSEHNKNEIKRVLKKEYHFDYDANIALNDKVSAELNRKAKTWAEVLEEMDTSKISFDSTIKPNRISKPEYYLKIAEAVSLRGTCLRRKFGAIIVKDDRIVSTGYAGAPRGRINCCDRGTCYRMEHNVPSGQRYELCRSTHAEMNAIIQASPEEMKFATLYLVGIENDGSYTNSDCCSMCKRVIINSGINTVIARQADGSFKKIHVNEWINDDDSLDIDHKGY